MELTVAELARRLGLPEGTVTRWIRQGRLPAVQRGDRCLFEQRELEAWARSHKLGLHDAPPASTPGEDAPVDLPAAFRRGGLHLRLGGHDVPSVLAAAVERTPVEEARREELLCSLLDREELSSTGIGNGVAVPHPRSPSPELAGEPSVTTCLLAQPVDFGAVDGKPVTAVLVLLAPSVRLHLKLLSQLAFLLRDPGFAAALSDPAPATAFWVAADEAVARLEAVRRR